jgi:hypothetical protein
VYAFVFSVSNTKDHILCRGITEGDIEIGKPCQEQFRSILWVVLPWWEESRCKVPTSHAAWDSSVPGILTETYRPFSSHQFHQIDHLAEQKTTTILGVFLQKCMWSRWAFVTTKPYKLRRLLAARLRILHCAVTWFISLSLSLSISAFWFMSSL